MSNSNNGPRENENVVVHLRDGSTLTGTSTGASTEHTGVNHADGSRTTVSVNSVESVEHRNSLGQTTRTSR